MPARELGCCHDMILMSRASSGFSCPARWSSTLPTPGRCPPWSSGCLRLKDLPVVNRVCTYDSCKGEKTYSNRFEGDYVQEDSETVKVVACCFDEVQMPGVLALDPFFRVIYMLSCRKLVLFFVQIIKAKINCWCGVCFYGC